MRVNCIEKTETSRRVYPGGLRKDGGHQPRRSLATIVLAVLLSVTSGVCEAQIMPAGAEHYHAQAGNPTGLRRWALPSETGGSISHWVGGGAPRWFRTDPPTIDEGTWGWDYRGLLVPRRVVLNWWHGRRYQGGTGAYGTDGPKLHTRE